MGGWQGYIVDTHNNVDGTTTVEIKWDSITLKNMPENTIIEYEFEGYDWHVYNLLTEDVMLTEPRDTVDDVDDLQESMAYQYGWIYLGDTKEQGLLIQNVVNSAKSASETDVFEAWKDHLESNLTFPYTAEVYESQHPSSSIKQGDYLKVLSLLQIDDMYGIIATVQSVRSTLHFPLCDLIPVKEKSPNHYHSRSYNLWFANR